MGTTRRGRTRATRSKLEKALDSLDAYIGGSGYEQALPDQQDRRKLEAARTTIADIEADLYRKERG